MDKVSTCCLSIGPSPRIFFLRGMATSAIAIEHVPEYSAVASVAVTCAVTCGVLPVCEGIMLASNFLCIEADIMQPY